MEPARHRGSPVGPVWPPTRRSVGATSSRPGPRKPQSHPQKHESGDAPRRGGKMALSGPGAGATASVAPRTSICGALAGPPVPRRRQAGPFEQVGSQRQDPRALETATVHKSRPPCSSEPASSPVGEAGGAGRRRLEGVRSPFWQRAADHISRLQLLDPRPSGWLCCPPSLGCWTWGLPARPPGRRGDPQSTGHGL